MLYDFDGIMGYNSLFNSFCPVFPESQASSGKHVTAAGIHLVLSLFNTTHTLLLTSFKPTK